MALPIARRATRVSLPLVGAFVVGAIAYGGLYTFPALSIAFADEFGISRSLAVTPSVGIALSRDPGIRPGELLADADMAMYFAKEESRSGFAFFEDELREHARTRLSLDAG